VSRSSAKRELVLARAQRAQHVRERVKLAGAERRGAEARRVEYLGRFLRDLAAAIRDRRERGAPVGLVRLAADEARPFEAV
jgi:hypothetical protein